MQFECINWDLKNIHTISHDCLTGGLFCFNRLNVMDRTDLGRQPFVYQEYTAMTNGEIYNHKSLEAEFGIQNRGNSDCELIPELFSKVGPRSS